MELTKIKGVGPKVAEVLKANGIPDLETLATAKVDDLKNILTKAGGIMANIQPDTWPAQAKSLLAAEQPISEAPSDAAETVDEQEAEPLLSEEDRLKEKINAHTQAKQSADDLAKDAAEAAHMLGTKKMKDLQALGGNVLYIERNMQAVTTPLRAVDAQRTPALNGDITGIVIFQETSSLEGKLPIEPQELVDMINNYIQEELGARAVVVGTSMKLSKTNGINPNEVEGPIKLLLRNAAAVIRAKMQGIYKEYKVPAVTNFDAFLPKLD